MQIAGMVVALDTVRIHLLPSLSGTATLRGTEGLPHSSQLWRAPFHTKYPVGFGENPLWKDTSPLLLGSTFPKTKQNGEET